MNRESFYRENGRKVYRKEFDGYFYIQTIKDIRQSELFLDEFLEVFDYQDLQELKNDTTEVYVLDKALPSTWSGILLEELYQEEMESSDFNWNAKRLEIESDKYNFNKAITIITGDMSRPFLYTKSLVLIAV